MHRRWLVLGVARRYAKATSRSWRRLALLLGATGVLRSGTTATYHLLARVLGLTWLLWCNSRWALLLVGCHALLRLLLVNCLLVLIRLCRLGNCCLLAQSLWSLLTWLLWSGAISSIDHRLRLSTRRLLDLLLRYVLLVEWGPLWLLAVLMLRLLLLLRLLLRCLLLLRLRDLLLRKVWRRWM